MHQVDIADLARRPLGDEIAVDANGEAKSLPKGTVVNADEANSWDGLHERFEMKRINHQEAYSQDGGCTN